MSDLTYHEALRWSVLLSLYTRLQFHIILLLLAVPCSVYWQHLQACSNVATTIVSYSDATIQRRKWDSYFSFFGDCGNLFRKPHSGLLLTSHWPELCHIPTPKPITCKENETASWLLLIVPEWNDVGVSTILITT